MPPDTILFCSTTQPSDECPIGTRATVVEVLVNRVRVKKIIEHKGEGRWEVLVEARLVPARPVVKLSEPTSDLLETDRSPSPAPKELPPIEEPGEEAPVVSPEDVLGESARSWLAVFPVEVWARVFTYSLPYRGYNQPAIEKVYKFIRVMGLVDVTTPAQVRHTFIGGLPGNLGGEGFNLVHYYTSMREVLTSTYKDALRMRMRCFVGLRDRRLPPHEKRGLRLMSARLGHMWSEWCGAVDAPPLLRRGG